jgi:hypothetical protein
MTNALMILELDPTAIDLKELDPKPSDEEIRAQRLVELSLVQVPGPVYFLSPDKITKNGGSAKRMAAQRVRQAASGLVSSPVPSWLVTGVKEIGGLTEINSADFMIGLQINRLKGWRRFLVMTALRFSRIN